MGRALLPALWALVSAAVVCGVVGYPVYQVGNKEAALILYGQENGTDVSSQAAMATYGEHPYGRQLSCHAVYHNEDLFNCGPQDCGYACAPPQGFKNDATQEHLRSYCMFLKMTESSRCFTHEQSLHAQQLGASAVILVDDRSPLRVPTYPAIEGEVSEQANVSIPVLSTMRSEAVNRVIEAATLASSDGGSYPMIDIDFRSVVPQSAQVQVELFATERDYCEASMGSYCRRKLNFIKMIAGWMVRLANQGALIFNYRSLVVSCQWTSEYCDLHCTNHRRYCVRRPPLGVAGVTGSDIVKHMAFSECVSKLGVLSGHPSFWWDFKLLDDEQCTIPNHTFTTECSESAVRSLGGNTLLHPGGGIQAIRTCAGEFDSDGENVILEDSLQDASRTNQTEVVFDPTYIINGVQYRGRWTRGAWFTAVCAGYPDGEMPALCSDPEVAYDDCSPGEYGAIACAKNQESGRTHCQNTFRGFECQCDPERFTPSADDPDSCLDKNECRTLSLEQACSCERCACHNYFGGYECEEGIPNVCASTAAGCWNATIHGKFYTACVDNIKEYKELSRNGEIPKLTDGQYSHDTIHACKCPSGFRDDGGGRCTPLCKSNPDAYLEGAGCVSMGGRKDVASVAGWILASVAGTALLMMSIKCLMDHRKKVLDAGLHQKLLGPDTPIGAAQSGDAPNNMEESQSPAIQAQRLEMGDIPQNLHFERL